MSEEIEETKTELPFRFQVEPVIGYKKLSVQLRSGMLALEGARSRYESLDETAKCMKKEDHEAPNLECDCGFYAYNSPRRIYYSGNIYATVEMFGTVISHTDGYRASRQRITHLAIERECEMCAVFNDDRRQAAALYFGMSGGSPKLLCSDHGEISERMHAAMKMTLAQASESLGIELVWYKGNS